MFYYLTRYTIICLCLWLRENLKIPAHKGTGLKSAEADWQQINLCGFLEPYEYCTIEKERQTNTVNILKH